VRVALLSDYPPEAPYRRATIDALHHAADAVGIPLDLGVHATDSLPFEADLAGVDGVVVGPGSPYRDDQAVWSVIRSARERGVPLVGT
jgi:CTP synthase (UTP-ammonia lyase)